jgi:hypothetical protein
MSQQVREPRPDQERGPQRYGPAKDLGVDYTPMTATDAERITTRIGLKLGIIADDYESVMPLLREAIDRKAYDALGYRSHSDYMADRFRDSLAWLPADSRRGVVRELTAAGMSTRGIAPIVGVNQSTVIRDQKSGDASASPKAPISLEELIPNPEERADILVMADVTEAEFEAILAEARAEGDLSRANVVRKIKSVATVTGEVIETPTKVIGLNGKQYSRQPTKPRRRRPLTDQFAFASSDLGKAVEHIERLVADDRFPRNKDAVARDANLMSGYRDRLNAAIDKMTDAHLVGGDPVEQRPSR